MKHGKLMAAAAFVSTLAVAGAAGAREGGVVATRPGPVADSDTALQVTASMIDAGRQVYHGPGTCFACHGQNLEGTSLAPSLADSTWKTADDGSYAAILKVIEEGVSGTAMQARPGGINDEQSRDVAAYVWAVSHGKAKP